MMEASKSYFSEIELPEPVVKRVGVLLEDFKFLIRNPKRVFICDLYDSESVRRFINLWFISENYVWECKNFLINDNIDIASIGTIKYLSINKEDISYPYEDFTIKSTYNLRVKLEEPTLRAEMFAVGSNCRHLHSLVVDYLLPRFVPKFE